MLTIQVLSFNFCKIMTEKEIDKVGISKDIIKKLMAVKGLYTGMVKKEQIAMISAKEGKKLQEN